MAAEKAKGGKKTRKYGRNARYCEAYKARNQRERNKIVRIARHLVSFPSDGCAKDAATRLAHPAWTARRGVRHNRDTE